MASKDVSVKCAEQYTDSGTVKVHHSGNSPGEPNNMFYEL